MTARENQLRRRLRFWTWLLILSLVFSGVTALPLQAELELMARWLGAGDGAGAETSSAFVKWIVLVRDALRETNGKFPFLAYGTDWLAFAHIVIAIVFVGALRHPVRNLWLYQFGLIASVFIIPWSLVTGEVRGIPICWRLIDCSFAIGGFVPCWLCLRWARELERMHAEGAR